ncbi:MAG: 2-oxoacid:acceptor oxidoreductase family protein [Candidatus Bathyarchaeia archaeon]
MPLIEIRWHGRGGQGIVTVSRLLAQAALIDGKYIQSLPEFGPERRGAPVTGYTRISDEPILIHSQVYTPGIVVVVDPTLIGKADITKGLSHKGLIVAHSDKSPKDLKEILGVKDIGVFTVDAMKIALKVLGRPIYNTAMLGALLKASPLVKMDSLIKVIRERFPGVLGEKNIMVIKRAYEEAVGI